MSSSLQHKTVRPGSLSGYSYYHSNRHPYTQAAPATKTARKKLRLPYVKLAILLIAVLLVGFVGYNAQATSDSNNASINTNQTGSSDTAAPAVAPVAKINRCEGNTLDKLIKVDISEQHLWGCEQGKIVHDAPVITGNENLDSTHTPRGEYKVYGKAANTTLTGSDEMGSWRMPVYFWMPFLDNQHGTYGFHDATWRPTSEFGKINPKTQGDKASHGCVELTKEDGTWLYGWAGVGTVLRVED
jgi:lipoprotein-anchoring transpeptidase ErfK/SrfK